MAKIHFRAHASLVVSLMTMSCADSVPVTELDIGSASSDADAPDAGTGVDAAAPDLGNEGRDGAADAAALACGGINDFCAGAGLGQVCLVGGYFRRGSDSVPASAPVERVFVQTFAIDAYEVTVARYRTCVALGDCTLPAGDADLAYYRSDTNLTRPVVGLALSQMEAFCRTDGGYLPSETQWEFAARGPSGIDLPIMCGSVNANGCEAGPATVGSHMMDRTPDAVFDLLGNVAEATSDRWEDGGYLAYADNECDPAHPTRVPSDGRIVVRGCSWRPDASVQCSGYLRRPSQRFAGTDDVGFRCASGS